jgi:large-conductance mechanosensitive channel
MKLNKRIVADISLAKTPKNEEDLDTEIAAVVGESATNIINGMVEDILRPAAKIIVTSIVTVTVVSAVCRIAVKTTRNH